MFWSSFCLLTSLPVACSESVYVVHYVILRDGLPQDVRRVREIDEQQLTMALMRANTSLAYADFWFSGSAESLAAFDALLQLPFLRPVAAVNFVAIQSAIERFYRTHYPGKCKSTVRGHSPSVIPLFGRNSGRFVPSDITKTPSRTFFLFSQAHAKKGECLGGVILRGFFPGNEYL